ncbi:uncharacterized protein METZ01_LOCUS350712, partial [marine metagenome]
MVNGVPESNSSVTRCIINPVSVIFCSISS